MTQPFEDGTDLRDFFAAAALDAELHSMRIIVAWAKRSGLARVADHLAAFRDRGGTIQAIAGVSEGGATRQGLAGLLEQTDEAWIFHDRGRTFHPKVYVAEGEEHGLLLVGSHNLTSGGLAWNYEAGLLCRLDFNDPGDLQIRDAVRDYFDRLVSDRGVCIRLTEGRLAAILANPSLFIQDEDQIRRPNAAGSDVPEDDDGPTADVPLTPSDPVFGRSAEAKRRALMLPGSTPAVQPERTPAPIYGSVAGSRVPVIAAKRWFKLLDGTAAQRPPGPNTNPTGNLRLSQEAFHIDHTSYFHEVFFGGMSWRPSETIAGQDELWLAFETVVDGDYLGAVNLRISHKPARISGQGNVPSVLHWGALGARLRQNN